MKKRILSVCILMTLCLPMFCVEQFLDRDLIIVVDCVSMRENLPYNWMQDAEEKLLTLFDMFGVYNATPIIKLSTTDIQAINKALHRFNAMKDELYSVAIGNVNNNYIRYFFVLITNVNGDNFYWDWVGRTGIQNLH